MRTCPADINGANMPFYNRSHITRYDLELYSLEPLDFCTLDTLNYTQQMPYITHGFLRADSRNSMGFILLYGKKNVSRYGFRHSVLEATRRPVCHVIMQRCAGRDMLDDAAAEAQLAEVEALRAKEMERLETLAGLSQEDAREVLLHKVDEELTHEKAIRVAAYETDLKENCDGIARNLIGQAISRCAADHCSETTVSVVPLPSDEMKGRIIGREGRNIRALETATGVDLIIDDTPEAITLSSFDQTRREVARMTLERLIGDGRIHPARIEETVEKCRHDLELQMKREGARAVMELGIHGLHPDLIKLIGRLKYRTSFGQNALTHSMEVAWLAGLLAGEMGVNVTLARRAGLLHDIGKALDHEIEGSHVQIGVDICRKYKENTQVIHAIEAHHGDVEPKTPLAFIIQACDAISAARPGARRENVESYVKRLENLEEISSSFEGVEQAFAVQAGREVRIMVKPDVISDDQVILLARSIAKKIEDTLDYPGQIKVNVIRESRAVEYAK